MIFCRPYNCNPHAGLMNFYLPVHCRHFTSVLNMPAIDRLITGQLLIISGSDIPIPQEINV